MPIIDGLSRQFKYSPGGVELVGFNTRLVDHGIALQKVHQFEGRTAVDPEPSPAMAGGLFSIHREYFFEVGAFDEEMEHWWVIVPIFVHEQHFFHSACTFSTLLCHWPLRKAKLLVKRFACPLHPHSPQCSLCYIHRNTHGLQGRREH